MACAVSRDSAAVSLPHRYASCPSNSIMCAAKRCWRGGATGFLEWKAMIITELIGNNKWLNPWIETQAEVSGSERKRRAERQRAPAARQKRARHERRTATTAAVQRRVRAGGYEPVRTLEAGSEKEAAALAQAHDKPRAPRRTAQQLQEAWNRGERRGLHECNRCHRILTSQPDAAHYSTKKCQINNSKS